MVKRSKEVQQLHDNVVSKVKSWLENKYENCDVTTNPGQEKNQSVIRNRENVYPDVVFRPKSGGSITRLYEVETEESVNEEEVKQWKLYNAGESNFYLVVPISKLATAKKLVTDSKFSIDGFHTYDSKLKIT